MTTTITPFRIEGGLLLVDAEIWSARDVPVHVVLALATSTSLTTLTPALIAKLGYSADTTHVARIDALGFELANLRVHVHELPHRGVDGLLGLDFLRRLDYQICSLDGRIVASLATRALR